MFPACAGVSLIVKSILAKLQNVPRVCGGEPHDPLPYWSNALCSLRVRGGASLFRDSKCNSIMNQVKHNNKFEKDLNTRRNLENQIERFLFYGGEDS